MQEWGTQMDLLIIDNEEWEVETNELEVWDSRSRRLALSTNKSLESMFAPLYDLIEPAKTGILQVWNETYQGNEGIGVNALKELNDFDSDSPTSN